MNNKCLLFTALLFLTIGGCRSKDNFADIQAILKSNEIQRLAHLTNNAEMLAGEIADTLINVSRGKILLQSNKEFRDNYTSYFKRIKYHKWDDIEDPIITFSEDGKLAEVFVRKSVIATYFDSDGNSEKGATVWAWSAVYKIVKGKWKVFSNASNREDFEDPSLFGYYNKALELKSNAPKYLEYIEKASTLYPGLLPFKFEYAKALVINKRYDTAFRILNELANTGYKQLSNIEDDSLFSVLKSMSGYDMLTSKIKSNESPVNLSKTAFTITERDLIPEGIAYDSQTEKMFISSIYKRKIVCVDKEGNISDFKKNGEDGLLATLGMEVDVKRRHLWVISSHTQELGLMINQPPVTDIPCAVYKYDVDTGELLNIYKYDTKTKNQLLNDLTVSGNGDVYITETMEGNLFKIPHDADKMELLLNVRGLYLYLNGLALNNEETKLYVSAWNGTFIYDIPTGSYFDLLVPRDMTLESIDGLAYYNNTLIAHQSSRLNAVMQYQLDESGTKVTDKKILESNNPIMDMATTGEIAGNGYYFIANAGVNNSFINNDNGAPIRIKPFEELTDKYILWLQLQ